MNITRLLPECMYFQSSNASSNESVATFSGIRVQETISSYLGDIVTWNFFKDGNGRHKLLIISPGVDQDLDYWSDRFNTAWYTLLSQEFNLIVYTYPESCDSNKAKSALETVVNFYLDKGYSHQDIVLYGVATGCSVVLFYVSSLVNPRFYKIVLESPLKSFKDALFYISPSLQPFSYVLSPLLWCIDELDTVRLSQIVSRHPNRQNGVLVLLLIINSMNTSVPAIPSLNLDHDYSLIISEYDSQWSQFILT